MVGGLEVNANRKKTMILISFGLAIEKQVPKLTRKSPWIWQLYAAFLKLFW